MASHSPVCLLGFCGLTPVSVTMLRVSILLEVSLCFLFSFFLLYNYFFSLFFPSLKIYLWLCWVFIAVWALCSCGEWGDPLAVVHGRPTVWLLLLRGTGSRRLNFSSCSPRGL